MTSRFNPASVLTPYRHENRIISCVTSFMNTPLGLAYQLDVTPFPISPLKPEIVLFCSRQ